MPRMADPNQPIFAAPTGYAPGGVQYTKVKPHRRRMPNPAAATGGFNYGSLPMAQQLGAAGIPQAPMRRGAAKPVAGPGPGGNVVMQGGQPTLGAYHTAGALPANADPSIRSARHNADLQYARARLAQLQRVVSLLPPELQQQLAASQRQIDPAAAWRAISGSFANYSRSQGFQDPRYYLQNYLPEQLRGQGRAPTGGV